MELLDSIDQQSEYSQPMSSACTGDRDMDNFMYESAITKSKVYARHGFGTNES